MKETQASPDLAAQRTRPTTETAPALTEDPSASPLIGPLNDPQGRGMRPQQALTLQRTVGNQQFGRAIQAPAPVQRAPARIQREVDPNLTEENSTRVGFEIEPGAMYTFTLPGNGALDKSEFEKVVNKTILAISGAVYTDGVNNPANQVVLEMLLDDVKFVTDKKATMQVEFRTVPLNVKQINLKTYNSIKRLIGAIRSADIFGDNPPHTAKNPLTTLKTYLTNNNITVTCNQIRFTANPPQHFTTSINIDAFAKLNEDHQAMLFPTGKGAKSKQELYAKVLNSMESTVNATTTGRNDAKAMLKTPIEALIAAETDDNTRNTLVTNLTNPDITNANRIDHAKTSNKQDDTFAVPTLSDSVDKIHSTGNYPQIQGEDVDGNPRGYRAIAEKLQLPLRQGDDQLRVLVEHRQMTPFKQGMLDKLTKNQTTNATTAAVKAMTEMDKKANQ